MDFEAARHTMVDTQVHVADVTDRRILNVMREIPREEFVPAAMKPLAYMDDDLPIAGGRAGATRYLMEPMIFARLVQLADIKAGELVLDIGCATGYSAAVLSRLSESVVAVESDPELARQAGELLPALDFGNVAVVNSAFGEGAAKHGPFDVIVLEGAVEQVPDALKTQLKEEGRLVAVVTKGPVGKAMVFLRHGGKVSGRVAFDANIPLLPGFEKAPGFTF